MFGDSVVRFLLIIALILGIVGLLVWLGVISLG